MRLFPYCKSLDRGRWGTNTVPPSVLLHHAGALHSLQDIDGVPYLSGADTVPPTIGIVAGALPMGGESRYDTSPSKQASPKSHRSS
eukprot:SAG31_NODE_1272_length_9064_cov_5.201004_10_plen_86_part_00